MLSTPSLSPSSCERYFKVGSTTRRFSVIGCLGYEHASPCCISNNSNNKNNTSAAVETAEIGVGTSTCDDGCNNTCAVCLESISVVVGPEGAPNKNIATTDCGHTFCLSCLLENLHTSNLCPLCRAPIEKKVKKVLKPLSYTEGIGLLDRELNGLRIYEDIEQYVQNAMEVSSQPNTSGQNVEDVIGDIMIMVTNFGFNLLYNATLHTNGSEEHMDPEWIIQMYNDDDDDSTILNDSGSDSTINDYNNDSDSDSDSDSDGSRSGDESDSESEFDSDNGDDDSKKKRIVLPEVPESMLE